MFSRWERDEEKVYDIPLGDLNQQSDFTVAPDPHTEGSCKGGANFVINHFAHDVVTSTKWLIMIDQSSIKMKQGIFPEKTYSDRSKNHGCRRKKVIKATCSA